MLELDHLVITAPDLETGTAWIENILGVPVQDGGAHALMGTHNRLLSLGPSLYLEVIAVNPAAPAPSHPRWFGLDHAPTAPRLSHWACRTQDIRTALSQAPPDHGHATRVTRGTLTWQMSISPTGHLPFDDLYPALLQWEGPNPAPLLQDQGIRLECLTISHPRASDLAGALAHLPDPRIQYQSAAPSLAAVLKTPRGLCDL